ncbi:MAG: hypothetical protein HLUCCA05_08590 [Roseibaca calidilacus]|uniref:Uncharacterized protein n=1 Tax=Roseibaca calidilacus TaxID=1666912 RepID=A0A0P7YSQ7_9RHOB|nr:hypothetical protein [Roseibaca calidilacus]KPP92328.1 MAG: hypothetical protein HLUCCA05_08590 [Roseibaca calidilacus]CUX79623.1 hypothetical protein Ga0058931_0307 [Roseibaca calidilacus]
MSRNPVAFVRMLTMASAVVLIVVSLAAIFAGVGPSGQTWAWIIGGTMFALSVLSLVVNMAFPGQSDCAWDEMNLAAHRASLVFGYWAALAAFLLMLSLVLTGWLEAQAAFYWMGPVLGIAPALHFLASILRGRAD